jgi:hypothetical protein
MKKFLAVIGAALLVKVSAIAGGASICASHPVPTNCVAVFDTTDPRHPQGKIVIRWDRNDPNPASYDIERSDDGGLTFRKIAQGYATRNPWYTDGWHGLPVKSGATYCFRVRVSGRTPGVCEGPYSNEGMLTIP